MQSSNQSQATTLLVSTPWRNQYAAVDVSLTDSDCSPESVPLKRGDRVVVDLGKGPEAAEVVRVGIYLETEGTLIRRFSPEDEYLEGVLREITDAAYRRCDEWLQEHQPHLTLLGIEPMLDCQTVYFHFLSEPETKEILDRLLEIYQSELDHNPQVKKVAVGCGNCGTSDHALKSHDSTSKNRGHGCSSCSVRCSIRGK